MHPTKPRRITTFTITIEDRAVLTATGIHQMQIIPPNMRPRWTHGAPQTGGTKMGVVLYIEHRWNPDIVGPKPRMLDETSMPRSKSDLVAFRKSPQLAQDHPCFGHQSSGRQFAGKNMTERSRESVGNGSRLFIASGNSDNPFRISISNRQRGQQRGIDD